MTRPEGLAAEGGRLMLATPQLVWGPHHGKPVAAALAAPQAAPALPDPPAATIDGPCGAFVYLGGWAWLAPAVNTPDKTRTLLRWLRNGLGVRQIVVPWTIVACLPTCPKGPEDYAWVGGPMLAQGGTPDVLFGVLDVLFDEARTLGVSVVLGLAESMMSCPLLWTDPAIRDLAAWMNETAAVTLEERYPDAAGWYLADESGACGPETIPFTKWQVQNVRAASALPLYASPFLGWTGHSKVAPQRLAADVKRWKAQTGVDHVLLQDSVGACGASLGGIPEEPTVKDYFDACANTVQPNCETGCYAEMPGLTTPPAGVTRFARQIAQASATTGRGGISWLPQAHLVPVDGAEPEALRFYHEFRAKWGLGGKLHPFGYVYLPGHVPHGDHADIGNLKLADGKVGTPFGPDNFKDPAHAGFYKTHLYARLTFARPVDVDFVGLNLLQDETREIGLPHTLQLSRDGGLPGTWTSHGLPPGRRLPAGKVGEYVMSNLVPLDWQAVTQLDVWASRTSPWLFCSEITVTEAG